MSLGIAAWATWIGFKALRISERVEMDAKRERERGDSRERMMWMQTLLNALKPLRDDGLAPHAPEYEDAQRWMRTALAAGSLRQTLPLTAALTERPIGGPRDEMIDAIEEARREIHDELERASDRFYAGEVLGL